MSGDDRLTWGLITDVLDVLERHGYHHPDDQHIGRAAGLIGDLACIYEGTREAAAGAFVTRTPASLPTAAEPLKPAASKGNGTIGAAEMRIIMAALDEAADHKRDMAANCGDCGDQSCGTCQFRLDKARSYEGVITQLQQTKEASTAGHPVRQATRGASIQSQRSSENEAGQ